MTIYIDDGESVKIYLNVKVKSVKEVMALLGSYDKSAWSTTTGYGVKVVDKEAGHLHDDIVSLPPVTPQEPKTGHWIRWYERKEYDDYVENIPHCKCSECGKEYDPHSSQFIKYCIECGARMFEPQE